MSETKNETAEEISFNPKFIHLRVHTAYSLSEGAIRVEKLMGKAKDMGYPAVAITDTANMFGAKKFCKVAKDNGIKPIIGSQFYLRNPDSLDPLKSKGRIIDPDKIVLLVMNDAGYRNMMKLMKKAYLGSENSSAEKPQIKLEDLADMNEGLICLSGGAEGPLGRLVKENRLTEAEEFLQEWQKYFGDRLYMEVSRIGTEDEAATENAFIDMAYKYNVPLVATNEAFFFDADMYEAHDALVCIAAGEYVANENRKRFSPNNRFRTQEEMLQLFQDLPEAVENTVNIAKRCSYIIDFVPPLLPKFDCGGLNDDEYIRKEALAGLAKRMEAHVYRADMSSEERKEIDEKYYGRLEYELSVIKKMGFASYFLIVSDFIQWSKDNGVPVGPGRGSGAGSIVAWSLRITDLDPLRFDLLFERFLNPERVNMPDFDVDFCQENRYKTIDYVQRKYGADCVAQIITYGKLQAKAVIRDIARVLQMPYSQADRISKMIPNGVQGKNPTLQEALDQVPELEEMRQNDPQINKLFDIAMKLEGLYRHTGVHAAGVVIGDRPLEELAPLYKDPRADMPVTQYDMKFVEETGLIKYDFLGLKTLTVIQKAVDLIKINHGIDVDINRIPLDDKPTYELLCRGDTAGVFQFESPGMKDVHRQIKPDRFEDLIAIVSLYRPGPMDNIPTYIKRKHGEEEITYLHPALAPILDETYGIMVYQEQVMKIAQVLGGYTLGGADKLRKVMGKKMREEIPKQRSMFMEGSVKNGIDADTAGKIFDQMEKFASYGFNKSHAAAYSLISYQTAYLKTHYPVEFMCATMSLDITNPDKLLFFKEECRKIGFKVLPPDINKSDAEFSVENGNIRYALAAIKGVGAANMKAIEDVRKKGGQFKDMSDFMHRMPFQNNNRRQLENMIKAGVFDSLEPRRGMLFVNTETICRHIQAATETRNSSQVSLFGDEELQTKVKLADKPDWPELERLKYEAEAIGFYLSAHPLDSYSIGLERLGAKTYAEVTKGIKPGDVVRAKIGGCVNSFQKRLSKAGNRYAFLDVSDGVSNFEGLLFSEGLVRYEDIINSGEPLLLSITIDKKSEDEAPRVMINLVETLDKAVSEVANGLIISLNSIEAVPQLGEILRGDRNGKNKIYIKPELSDWDVRIELSGGFAFYGDILSRIRGVSGITSVKEI